MNYLSRLLFQQFQIECTVGILVFGIRASAPWNVWGACLGLGEKLVHGGESICEPKEIGCIL